MVLAILLWPPIVVDTSTVIPGTTTMIDFVNKGAHPSTMVLLARSTLFFVSGFQVSVVVSVGSSAPAKVVHHHVALVAVHADWDGWFVEPDYAVFDPICLGAVDFVGFVATDNSIVSVECFVIWVFTKLRDFDEFVVMVQQGTLDRKVHSHSALMWVIERVDESVPFIRTTGDVGFEIL
jgi:hypothetical protein